MRKKFNTSLDEKIIKQLKIQAVTEGRDACKIIEEALAEYFKKTA